MTRYLALGDSMSIDKYTGTFGGGAANQLARLLRTTAFHNATEDGATTEVVLRQLEGPEHWVTQAWYDVITLTIGGNDLLAPVVLGKPPVGEDGWRAHASRIAVRFEAIAEHLLRLCAPRGQIIFNTVYDPTDGNDARLGEMELPVEARIGLDAYNEAVRRWTWNERLKHSVRLTRCDVDVLFRGHGFWSQDPWLTLMIEPNLAGATAIATAWNSLFIAS